MKKFYIIKGQKYTIHQVCLTDCVGLCNPNDHTILIHKHLNAKDKKLVLYHELGHALLFELGLNQTSMAMDLHEIIVEGFSGLIYELLHE